MHVEHFQGCFFCQTQKPVGRSTTWPMALAWFHLFAVCGHLPLTVPLFDAICRHLVLILINCRYLALMTSTRSSPKRLSNMSLDDQAAAAVYGAAGVQPCSPDQGHLAYAPDQQAHQAILGLSQDGYLSGFPFTPNPTLFQIEQNVEIERF